MDGVEARPDSGKDQGGFWDEMAGSYPLPFDRDSLADTSRIIGLVEARGVEMDGAEILDIGCGTGICSLPLARRAARVTGLDSSRAMLAVFERECRRHGITNASAMHLSWQDADVAALGLVGGFDIVWTSMTPAVRGRDDLARMQACSRRWCVYIGWGGVRRNALLEEVFRAHGLGFAPPPGARAVQAILAGQGTGVDIDFIRTHWDWQGGEDEALEYACGFVASHGGSPDREVIAAIVAGHCSGGLVRHRTEVEMGVLVWRCG